MSNDLLALVRPGHHTEPLEDNWGYTPELHAAIVELVRRGNFPEVAAASVGVSRKTLDKWLLAGRSGDGRFINFERDVMGAAAQAEVGALQRVTDAAAADPEYAKFFLTHGRSSRWAAQVKHQVEAELSEVIARLEASELDERTLDYVLQVIAGEPCKLPAK